MRFTTRLVSVLLAIGLLGGGLLAAAEILTGAIRHRPLAVGWDSWYRTGVENPWSATSVRWVCIALVLAGLALLVLALAKRPPVALDLAPKDGEVPGEVQRASLAESITRAAVGVDGVSDAKVRLRPKGAKVVASTTRHDPGDLQARVASAVTGRLSTVGLAEPPAVDVSVEQKERR